MLINGVNFGPVHLSIKDGTVVEASRPISYMAGWTTARVLKLAERWGWKITVSDDELAQLPGSPAAPATETSPTT
jgi:hypothetical protein